MQKLEHTTIATVLTNDTQSTRTTLRGFYFSLWALFTLGLYPFTYCGGKWC